MTIHKERHVFGSYAHGIQGSGSPADDPDHKFVDGNSDFDQNGRQGGFRWVRQEGNDMVPEIEFAQGATSVAECALGTIRPRRSKTLDEDYAPRYRSAGNLF